MHNNSHSNNKLLRILLLCLKNLLKILILKQIKLVKKIYSNNKYHILILKFNSIKNQHKIMKHQ